MAYKYPYGHEDEEYTPPKVVLETNRSVWKFIILNVLTLGIYSIIFFIPLSFDLDKVSPRRDGEKTMNYLLAYILAFFTFSIVIDIWHYQIAKRVEETLSESDIDYNFGTGDFWKWFILGSLIFFGPFVYLHKLCKAMNLICEDYNKKSEQEQLQMK